MKWGFFYINYVMFELSLGYDIIKISKLKHKSKINYLDMKHVYLKKSKIFFILGIFLCTFICAQSIYATGETITYTDANGLNPRSSEPYAGGYTIHTFTSNGTFDSTYSGNAAVLVVAGGGGGGGNYGGGGGGGGGVLYNAAFPISATSYEVIVGSGGAIQANGGNSVFSSLTAIGGGAGGVNTSAGNSGGSGGGGGGKNAMAGGLGTSGQGYGGGTGAKYTGGGWYIFVGGGGGGAAAGGNNALAASSSMAYAGNGGSGRSSGISGTTQYYGGGGGGGSHKYNGSYYYVSTGVGGIGGGGNGWSSANVNGTDGVASTGGGGGGGNYVGGSGIVIIRYPTPLTSAVVTNAATMITSNSAQGNAAITNIGVDNPARHIEWGTVSGIYTNSCSAGIGITGTYFCDLTDLAPNTTYYVRAKATNAAGTSYGSETSFTTLPIQDVTISNPMPVDIQNAISSNYVSLNSGAINSTSQATAQSNITFRTSHINALFPMNTSITEMTNGNFNFQNFTLQELNVINEQPTSQKAFRLGVSGTNLNFSQNVTVTVDIPQAFNDQTLDILYQKERESTWHNQGTCVVTNGRCTFTTNHATIYTINGNHQATGNIPMNLNVQVQETLSMDCFDPSDSNTTVSLGTTLNPGMITAGIPAVGQSRCTVITNADQGYYLTLTNSNPANSTLTHTDPHTSALYEISDATAWNESTKTTTNWTAPTTKGLAFSVINFPETDTTHNQFDGIWNQTNHCPEGTNPDTNDYAGIPPTPQAISAVTSYQANATTTDICYKVDVLPSQPSGQYSGQVTFTATSDASGYYQ